jgi:hypothetical protein
MAKEEQPRRITLFNVLAWIFSILFGIPALFFLFSGSVATGVWLFLAALALFPPLANWVKTRFNLELSRTLRTVLAIILFVGYAVSLSTSAFLHPAASASAGPPSVPTVAASAAVPPTTAPPVHRSARIQIDRATTAVANLQPIRVTVTNTGDVAVTPKFDVTVTDTHGTEVCSGSPLYDDFTLLTPGNAQTGEFSIMGCTFRRDGTYTVRVDVLDSDFTKLGSDAKDVTVAYWSTFS